MQKIVLATLIFLLSASSAFCASSLYTPAMSLSALKQGNLRFVGGKQMHPRQSRDERMHSLTGGQNPKAVVLSCADARVPVEVLFDQGIGDLFVFRVPGNTAGRDVQVGIWHAISTLRVPLVVVLGHNDCQAINSVCAGEAETLLPDIAKVVRKLKSEEPELMARPSVFKRRVVLKNVQNSIDEILDKQPAMTELIATSRLMLVGALYDLESGKVEWLTH